MRRALAGVIVVMVAGACSSFSSTGGLVGSDAGVEGGSSSSVDAANGDGSTNDAASDCPGTHGPVGVRVGSYCIDATEVTRKQYTEFLDTKQSDTSGQRAECTTNTSFLPRRDFPYAPGEEDHPVMGVDWCDAVAYCTWAGKRLCGRIGGGAVAKDDLGDATQSQWFAACSANGAKALPYGNTFDPLRCNGGDALATGKKPVRVKQLAQCEGGFPGLFDMSGNAYEWEDACDGSEPSAGCFVRGGDFNEPSSTMGCGTAITQPRLGDGRWGFRCCSL